MKQMARLRTLQPRLSPAPTRKLPEPSGSAGWGSGRGGRPWRRIRERILARDCYTCQHCGRVTDEPEVDHIKNIAQGGTDDDSNLQVLCAPCHKAKTAQESVGRS